MWEVVKWVTPGETEDAKQTCMTPKEKEQGRVDKEGDSRQRQREGRGG